MIASALDVNDPARLSSLIKKHRITSLRATPSYLRTAILQCPNLTAGVRVLVGGEALPSDLAKTLLKSSSELWNLYGPTEATIWASIHRVRADEVGGGSASFVTIGKPLANYRMYVLDKGLRAVPAGGEGELFIGGRGLAKEYFGKPELTAERFLVDIPGVSDRLYRTGDLARARIDGDLEFLGREDQQVKIHGIRLELGDVESALRQLPQIQDAVAVVRESPSGDKELTGYVVVELAGRFDANLLRRTLSDRVPAYMVPTTICHLDAIPPTAHGKIDRKRLPDPQCIRTDQKHGQRDPKEARLYEEARLYAIFAEVLGVTQVEPGDNFFDLGGHSLAGMRLINQVRSEFHIDLSLRDLFDALTFAELCGELLRLQDRAKKDGRS